MIGEGNILAGKKILFMGQVFYDYHLKIIHELERQGAEVTFFENKFFPEDNGTSRPGLVRSLRRLFLGDRKKKYTQQIMVAIGSKKFDYFFSIGGFSITQTLLDFLKLNNEKLISIVYFWDSFSVWNYADLIPLFNRVYSFDPVDCEANTGVQYLPLFYTKEYEGAAGAANQDIDFLYVGSVGIPSQNRCDLLLDLDRFSRKNGYNAFLWLYYAADDQSAMKRIKNKMKLLFLPSYRKFMEKINESKLKADFIKDKVIDRAEVADLMSRAKCIIDIPVPGQAGLTIRTIETLAAGKKIITTNKYVKRGDFYDPSYIKVVDHSVDEINEDFVRTTPLHRIDLSPLRLSEWISTFFK
ncbi:MAG: hypothetical protein J7623_23985 [Chitinophaga sp.]|uniref:hypothetical protein n=1 Tax=Chitinophaga sp. TaxID=1869181 RepID=UPI001B0C664D|nr:hypothetical protein [Chitinophaga sp.]MBO9731722.1 hypothetical protein [Chitinophaga sp.]